MSQTDPSGEKPVDVNRITQNLYKLHRHRPLHSAVESLIDALGRLEEDELAADADPACHSTNCDNEECYTVVIDRLSRLDRHRALADALRDLMRTLSRVRPRDS